MEFRNVGAMNRINDAAHSRSLTDSIMMPQVISAVRDWTKADAGGVLIGGAALSFHVRPRMTQDLNFLVIDEAEMPRQAPGFTHIGPILFRHRETGVEVHVATSTAIGVPSQVAEEVAQTAMLSDGVRVASESGLVAMKLFRRSRQDEADIVALIKTGRVDLTRFPLTPDKMSAFRELVEVATTDPHPP